MRRIHQILDDQDLIASALEQECPYCGVSNKFENLGIIEYKSYSDQIPDGYASLNRCTRKGCKKISMFVHDHHLKITIVNMPKIYTGLDESIDPDVHKSFIEAVNCFNTNLMTAAAIMFRRTIELSTVKFGEIEGGLQSKIKSLRKKELITEDLMRLAQRIKSLGDEGAHPEILIKENQSINIKAEDVKQMKEFCESYLKYVYILPEQVRKAESK